MSGSWRTTAAGIVLGLGILLTQVGAFLDSDPNTKPDTTAMLGGLAMIGGAVGLGVTARDNKVSSEQVGAGPKSTL